MHRILILLLAILAIPASAQESSVCHGTTSNGTLENGWKLPASGANFFTHWTVGRLAGRSYVHSSVHRALIDAYAQLEKVLPDGVFVYGETGWEDGGRFKPHKTHRNGLSVDFMVPVLDGVGKSVELPSSILNKWGYGLEFDSEGNLDDLRIDFAALAEHIYQLDVSTKKHGIGIWRVIFDPKLQPYLHDSPRWTHLKEYVKFSARPSWVRHDEHYHVDFDVACKPL